MMKLYNTYFRLIKAGWRAGRKTAWRSGVRAFMALFMLLSLSTCGNAVFEDLEPCEKHYYVKYVFDMNMNYADAFSSAVKSVELYIFDEETGKLVDTYYESGDALKQPGYRMEIDVLPGKYDFVVWCGLEDNEGCFTLPETITHRDHAHCRMDRQYTLEGRAMQDRYLHSLFHGKVTDDLPDETEYEVIIPLIKDTNNINIAMQHVSGETLTKDMFTVTMTEGNGHLAHDNSLILDEDIDFYPWHQADGSVDIGDPNTRADEEDSPVLNYFRAEISTPRLMEDRDPRINIVENSTGKTVYSIPIVQWALEFRSERHASMGEQEYLDREDEFNVMLYLDNGDSGWVAASIFINGWRVVKHDNTVM